MAMYIHKTKYSTHASRTGLNAYQNIIYKNTVSFVCLQRVFLGDEMSRISKSLALYMYVNSVL